ncbi:hypothetical protein [Priestia megaterium]|uniref:hypothetical protein n=1 Tax=Priestia megaterium TaxID=1404 RepID=UPI000BF79283|nr:hypothetical protein [Priestia megaterium]PFR88905.1 hypothetical protein COK39_25680 [Priestia megaterium]
MGKRFGIVVLFVLFLCLSIPQIVHADALLSGQIDKKPPKNPKDLNEDERAEVLKLEKEMQELYEEYFGKVVVFSEKKLNEKYIEKDNNMIREGVVRTAIEKGHAKYEQKYFGSPKKYEDGLMGGLAKKLWSYGILVEFDREKAGVFDSCVKPGGLVIVGDGLCEGVPKFSYTYKDKELTYTVPKLQFINGKDPDKKDNSQSQYPLLITSDGLFTQAEVYKEEECKVSEVSQKFNGNKQIGEPEINEERLSLLKPKTLMEYASDKVGHEMASTMRGLIDSLDKHFFDSNCSQNSVSVLSQLTNVSKPVTLTDNRLVMAVVHIVTQISFSFTIVLIAFYSLMFTTGYQNLDPIKFALRLFFVLITINYLPYLIQDVLNLNNKIVFELSHIKLTFDEITDDNGNVIESVAGKPVDLLSGSLDGMFTNLMENVWGTKELLMLIMLFVVLFFAAVPLFRLVLWYYFRMLKIFLMACVAPLLLLTLVFPQTSGYGKRWISQFVGEVFSQVFVSIGFLFISVLISNLGEFAYRTHLGWFGVFLFLLASTFFAAELPSWSKSMLDGVTSMGENGATAAGHRMGRGVQVRSSDISKGIVKGLSGKTAGRTTAGKVLNKAAKSVPSGGANLVRGLQGKGLSQKNPGISGRIGHSLGGGLNKVGTKTGNTMQRIADKTGTRASVDLPNGIGTSKAVAGGIGAGFIASKSMSMGSPNKRLKISNDLKQTETGTGVSKSVSELNKRSQEFASANTLSSTMSQAVGTVNDMKKKRSSLFGNTSEPKTEQEQSTNSSAQSTPPTSEVQQRINQNKEQIRDMKRKQESNKKKMNGNDDSIKNKESSASQIPPIVFGEQFKTPQQRPNNNNVIPNKTNNKAPNKQSSTAKKTTPTKKVDKPKEPLKSNGTLPTLPQFQSPVQQPTSSKKTTDKSTEKPNKPSEIKKKD